MCDHSYNQIPPTFVELLIEIRDLEVGGQRLLRGRDNVLLGTNCCFCFVTLQAAIGSVSLDLARQKGFTGQIEEDFGIQVNFTAALF